MTHADATILELSQLFNPEETQDKFQQHKGLAFDVPNFYMHTPEMRTSSKALRRWQSNANIAFDRMVVGLAELVYPEVIAHHHTFASIHTGFYAVEALRQGRFFDINLWGMALERVAKHTHEIYTLMDVQDVFWEVASIELSGVMVEAVRGNYNHTKALRTPEGTWGWKTEFPEDVHTFRYGKNAELRALIRKTSRVKPNLDRGHVYALPCWF
jgi:hypothetical protein